MPEMYPPRHKTAECRYFQGMIPSVFYSFISGEITDNFQIPQDVSANKIRYENRAVLVDCKFNKDAGNYYNWL